jgi:hypothetical protein
MDDFTSVGIHSFAIAQQTNCNRETLIKSDSIMIPEIVCIPLRYKIGYIYILRIKKLILIRMA